VPGGRLPSPLNAALYTGAVWPSMTTISLPLIFYSPKWNFEWTMLAKRRSRDDQRKEEPFEETLRLN
jgi:hypothetical protein